MKNKIFCKSLVIGIIILFIGAGVATGISGKIYRNDIEEKNLNILSNQNVCLLNFCIFDKTWEKQKNVNLPVEAAKNINDKLDELRYMIIYKPRSDETQNLIKEFVDLLDTNGLIPAGLSKDYVISLLNQPWLKNKQKTPETKTILSKNYISSIIEKILYLQQIFKSSFGKTVPNIFDKNNIKSPSSQTNATVSFCKISSAGSGTTFPPFLMPRPRAIAIWSAFDAQTMIAELLTAKFLVAQGAQTGTMLGFIGIGISYSFPGEIFYGFMGYALSTKVSADYIQFLPPN